MIDGAEVLARGVAACPGVAAGRAVGDSDAAEAAADTVLVRPTTSPEDVSGMIAARAVVTERGGSTSHAAVVTRALGRPSVVGVGEGVSEGLAGRELTVDGSAGLVYAGLLPTEEVDPAEVPGLDRADRVGAGAEPGRGRRRGARRGRPRRRRHHARGGRARPRGDRRRPTRCRRRPRLGPGQRRGRPRPARSRRRHRAETSRTTRGGAAAATCAGEGPTRGGERDVSDSNPAARPYPDKWARESATPTVEHYHSAIRALVAERFAASGKSWEEAVLDPELALTREDFEQVEADAARRGLQLRRLGDDLAEGGARQIQTAGGHRRLAASNESDEQGRPIVGPATTSSRRAPTSPAPPATSPTSTR